MGTEYGNDANVARTSSIRTFGKDKTCLVCIEESGSRVAHWRKKYDRQTGVIHLDLAAFEPSTDGRKYRLVAAVTVEIDKVSKLTPIFVPMPKKDAVSGLAAIKETLTLRSDRNLRQITGSRITRIQADGGGEYNNQKLKDLRFEKNIVLSFSPAHQPLSDGIAERMVGMLKTIVRRLLKQALQDI